MVLTSQNATQSSSKLDPQHSESIAKPYVNLLIMHFRLLKSLGNFVDQVDISLDVNTTNNQTVFALKTYALQVQDIVNDDFQGQTFRVDLGTVEDTKLIERRIEQSNLVTVDGFDNQTNATASVTIPEDILDEYNADSCSNLSTNVTNTTPRRLSYSVFLSDVLFQSVDQSHLRVGSIIMAARLKCSENKTLNMPIKTTFQTDKNVSESAMLIIL